MRKAVRVTIGAIAILVVAAVSAVLIGRYTFNRSVDREVTELFERSVSAEPSILTEADIAHLPEPVQRWLRYSNVVGKERPRTVRLKQEGEIRMGPDRPWMPFTAEQYYTTNPPSFIWHVDAQMMPLISFAGRDRYVDGRGNMDIRVLSLIPVVNETGLHMDQCTLMRYLNEVMWFPAGAVSPYIVWESVDANAAKAIMSHGGTTVEAIFYFDGEGRLTNMIGDRYQDAGDGEIKWLPWKTPVEEYGEFNGVRIPVSGEGVWEEEWGDFDYVRLRIVDIEYNVPELY
jgi:hypothetical protein